MSDAADVHLAGDLTDFLRSALEYPPEGPVALRPLLFAGIESIRRTANNSLDVGLIDGRTVRVLVDVMPGREDVEIGKPAETAALRRQLTIADVEARNRTLRRAIEMSIAQLLRLTEGVAYNDNLAPIVTDNTLELLRTGLVKAATL